MLYLPGPARHPAAPSAPSEHGPPGRAAHGTRRHAAARNVPEVERGVERV